MTIIKRTKAEQLCSAFSFGRGLYISLDLIYTTDGNRSFVFNSSEWEPFMIILPLSIKRTWSIFSIPIK